MDVVQWSHRPALRQPVLIASFEGWNDAGDAATTAVRWLADRLGAEQVATIDGEDFYDYTSVRPNVEIVDGATRRIEWPDPQVWAAHLPDAARDVAAVIGHEPQLRWRRFCATIVEAAQQLDVRLVVTLGALLAEVPHSRPTSVIGTAEEPAVIARLGLQPSTYEGPTGITGVLHAACRDAGIESASLWAAVPTYVPGAPSPKAALALVERTMALLDLAVPTTDLEIAAASYERQIDELVAADDDTATYVARLEEEADDEDAAPFGDGARLDESQSEALVEEVERFLRRQQ